MKQREITVPAIHDKDKAIIISSERGVSSAKIVVGNEIVHIHGKVSPNKIKRVMEDVDDVCNRGTPIQTAEQVAKVVRHSVLYYLPEDDADKIDIEVE